MGKKPEVTDESEKLMLLQGAFTTVIANRDSAQQTMSELLLAPNAAPAAPAKDKGPV